MVICLLHLIGTVAHESGVNPLPFFFVPRPKVFASKLEGTTDVTVVLHHDLFEKYLTYIVYIYYNSIFGGPKAFANNDYIVVYWYYFSPLIEL